MSSVGKTLSSGGGRGASSSSFSSSDQDITKLIRAFIIKAPQIVIHARRTGLEHASTTTITNAAFNFDMREIPRVKQDVKTMVSRNHYAQISLDILVQNTEEKTQSILIERWTFHYEPYSIRSQSQKKIYTRLIILLRSIYSLARLLPAYDIVRVTNNDDVSTTTKLTYKIADSLDGAPIFSDSTESFVFSPVVTSEGKLHVSVLYQENCEPILKNLSGLHNRVSEVPNLIQDFYSASRQPDPEQAPRRNSFRGYINISNENISLPMNLGIEPALPTRKSIPIPIGQVGGSDAVENSSRPGSSGRGERTNLGGTPPSLFSHTPDGSKPSPATAIGTLLGQPSSLGKTPPPFIRNGSLKNTPPNGGRPLLREMPNPNFRVHKFSSSGVSDDAVQDAKSDRIGVRRMSTSSNADIYEEQFFIPSGSSNLNSQDSLLGAIVSSSKNAPTLRVSTSKVTRGDELISEFDLLTQQVYQTYSSRPSSR